MPAIGVPWPMNDAHVNGYMSTLKAGEATQSRLDRAPYARYFMEQAGGVPAAAQLSTHPLLQCALAEQALVQTSPGLPTVLGLSSGIGGRNLVV